MTNDEDAATSWWQWSLGQGQDAGNGAGSGAQQYANSNTHPFVRGLIGRRPSANIAYKPVQRGTGGSDTLTGNVDSEHINGLGGNDKLSGDAGRDIVAPPEVAKAMHKQLKESVFAGHDLRGYADRV